MIDGKMVPLGMCEVAKAKVPKSPKFFDNTTPKPFWGECVNKHNA